MYALIQAMLAAGVLMLIVVALFLAIGLLAGLLATVIPPLASQGTAFAHNAPDYLHHLAQRYPVINACAPSEQIVAGGSPNIDFSKSDKDVSVFVLAASTLVFGAPPDNHAGDIRSDMGGRLYF